LFHLSSEKPTQGKCIVSTIFFVIFVTRIKWFEKIGIDADYTIEKKLFWIHPNEKTFF